MKLLCDLSRCTENRRTPRGVRGLKPERQQQDAAPPLSHPARGAWIETEFHIHLEYGAQVAPREGCVD